MQYFLSLFGYYEKSNAAALSFLEGARGGTLMGEKTLAHVACHRSAEQVDVDPAYAVGKLHAQQAAESVAKALSGNDAVLAELGASTGAQTTDKALSQVVERSAMEAMAEVGLSRSLARRVLKRAGLTAATEHTMQRISSLFRLSTGQQQSKKQQKQPAAGKAPADPRPKSKFGA